MEEKKRGGRKMNNAWAWYYDPVEDRQYSAKFQVDKTNSPQAIWREAKRAMFRNRGKINVDCWVIGGKCRGPKSLT